MQVAQSSWTHPKPMFMQRPAPSGVIELKEVRSVSDIQGDGSFLVSP